MDILRIVDGQAELPALRRIAELRDEAAECPADMMHARCRDEQLHCQIGPIIKIVVLAERAVPRGLDCQRRYRTGLVQADAFIDDILVAAHIAVMLQAKPLLKEYRELVRGHRIRHDRAARIIRRQDCRHHRDERIAADLLPVRQHGAHPVDIGIKNEPEIRLIFQHRLLDGRHRRRIFRIRHMVREPPIRFQIQAAADIRSQGRQHLAREETAGAVAGIHDDMHARQRVRRIRSLDAGLDLLLQMRRIAGHQIIRSRPVQPRLLRRALPRELQQFPDLGLFQPAIPREELHAIAV